MADKSFCVKTPMGTLKASVKPDECYPGIDIILKAKNGEEIYLACVEYDSAKGSIRTHVYGEKESDYPTYTTDHKVYNIEKPIKNDSRLIRPCNIPKVVQLNWYVQELNEKYGLQYGLKDGSSLMSLNMEMPLVSHLYESNVYFFLYGCTSDIASIPEYCNPPISRNTVMWAGEHCENRILEMEDKDKQKLVSLRQQAYDAIREQYPRVPESEFCSEALNVKVFVPPQTANVFEVEYDNCFSTRYKNFQYQEELPHESLAYKFYKKWNVFHCVKMTKDEFQEMMADLEELKCVYS